MKVIAINGSPRIDGSTFNCINIVANALLMEEIETEIIHVGDKNIRGCLGCRRCRVQGNVKCIYNDIVNECIDKAIGAQGIIFGSPIYYSGISGNLKCFLDRFFYCGGGSLLSFKVGCGLVVGRRTGGVLACTQIYNYFNNSNIIVTPSNEFNVIHGTNKEEILLDEEGVQVMEHLGRNMAWLIKIVADGVKKNGLPKTEKKIRTNFIR